MYLITKPFELGEETVYQQQESITYRKLIGKLYFEKIRVPR